MYSIADTVNISTFFSRFMYIRVFTDTTIDSTTNDNTHTTTNDNTDNTDNTDNNSQI